MFRPEVSHLQALTTFSLPDALPTFTVMEIGLFEVCFPDMTTVNTKSTLVPLMLADVRLALPWQL